MLQSNKNKSYRGRSDRLSVSIGFGKVGIIIVVDAGDQSFVVIIFFREYHSQLILQIFFVLQAM